MRKIESQSEIKKATPEDIDAICEVERSAFPPNRQASKETLKKRIELFPQGCFVVFRDGKLLGFTTALLTDNLKTLAELDPSDEELHNPEGEIYYFRSIGIHKDVQREGLGKALIAKHLENAKRLGKRIFRFTASEDVADYYEKLGCRRITDYDDFHGSVQAVWEKQLGEN